MSRRIDLKGQKFGKLTALEYVDTRNKMARWLCRCDCGKTTIVYSNNLRRGLSQSCGCEGIKVAKERLLIIKKTQHGSSHPGWIGGRVSTGENSYIKILQPSHPKATNNYVYEHVLVMEKTIGRPLNKEEIVHHVNGIKHDNRPENLMLFGCRADHVRFHFGASILQVSVIWMRQE